MPRRLLIEGWRFIHHSYALIAQAHALCLLARPDVDLRFRDLPYFHDTWQRVQGLFDAAREAQLAAIPAPEPGFEPNATWTLSAERPDFTSPRSGRKFVFGTPEYRRLLAANVGRWRSAHDVAENVDVITSSRWTALAYTRFGFPQSRVHVVPHGIDPSLMRVDEDDRTTTRRAMKLTDQFVFASVGAMTSNKGIDVLFRAFAEVARREPRARLVLKGADALYTSREYVGSMLDDLPTAAREAVASRLVYTGDTFSARQTARFLRAADCYVSPYRAEGFNMPVMEAAACGVPVICTAGGPTDEFTTEAFAARVHGTIVDVPISATETGDMLEPDPVHLAQLMLEAVADPAEGRRRGAVGAQHMARHFTWDAVTAPLLQTLMGSGGS